ncbi:hypothetical protein A2926_02105 [Candidatus Giovannonibacteria bacterium RIFCSPLOWO2_01_FULL_44_40]|uniref:Polymerase beta nucleotidyltransferase domain-containing protein n=1 Tax=Candidatus Giovannonibacteria bacterium RIFCSPHIGHO2_01_FULL_45_23 TaxID=1798325 RepID=A0A1F5VFF5_9BACT|nr:MAG: hypothetical protein A2834_02195 [Candidatus Giovannonibacteria bacterium RIFCSPHIGHO2_01_FULL_45_23]OGF80364.1 MAG: hypothetical protein A2926_02105 [Candidatus Giovannonibacteria bacterium RIFCSPLOWO2_01_FULL_44_40]
MDKYIKNDLALLKQDVVGILEKHIDLKKYKVFLFGSRASGTSSSRSDIDIGIEGAEPLPARVWCDIQEEVENLPTLHKIEIVDFKDVAPIFKKVALEHAQPINP